MLVTAPWSLQPDKGARSGPLYGETTITTAAEASLKKKLLNQRRAKSAAGELTKANPVRLGTQRARVQTSSIQPGQQPSSF